MLDEKDLQAISALMDSKLQPIQQDIQEMKSDIQEMKLDIQDLKDNITEVRGATNYLVEWVEKVEKKVDEIA